MLTSFIIMLLAIFFVAVVVATAPEAKTSRGTRVVAIFLMTLLSGLAGMIFIKASWQTFPDGKPLTIQAYFSYSDGMRAVVSWDKTSIAVVKVSDLHLEGEVNAGEQVIFTNGKSYLVRMSEELP
ncbi:MAG: hypothetical protein AAB613_02610 [Patescibacteria group bacterium]